MADNLHVRIALLSPGPEVTPLKFRGWLRAEAASIDEKSRASGMTHHVSVIRLFLPERVRFTIGQAKLDKILQDIVDKFETIQRVELRGVDVPLTFTELLEAQEEARGDLATIDGLLAEAPPGDNTSIH
jgi:hypothetical protein